MAPEVIFESRKLASPFPPLLANLVFSTSWIVVHDGMVDDLSLSQ